MAKTIDKQKMRARIMAAALAVYARTGFHAATIDEIAKEAKLGKGTLYLYFKGKDDLTTALITKIFQDMEERLISNLMPETLDEFTSQIRGAVQVTEDQAKFIRVFFDIFGPSFATDEFMASIGGFFDRLGIHYGAQIAHLQDIGKVDPARDSQLTGRVLVSMLDGIVLHRGLFAIVPARYDVMAEEAITTIANGLRPSA